MVTQYTSRAELKDRDYAKLPAAERESQDFHTFPRAGMPENRVKPWHMFKIL